MIKKTICLFTIIICLQSCSFKERERKLDELQKELTKKEQDLMLREQGLEVRERQLADTKQSLDSVKNQIKSAETQHPVIVGRWVVKMSCVETSCDGSALGDTKTEQWDIRYNGGSIVVKAYSGKVLTRIYTGSINGNVLQITDESQDSDVSIGAILKLSSGRLAGKREIHQKDCKIIYAVTAEKL